MCFATSIKNIFHSTKSTVINFLSNLSNKSKHDIIIIYIAPARSTTFIPSTIRTYMLHLSCISILFTQKFKARLIIFPGKKGALCSLLVNLIKNKFSLRFFFRSFRNIVSWRHRGSRLTIKRSTRGGCCNFRRCSDKTANAYITIKRVLVVR